jgi:16S rRNA (cytosine967-C5)-methyltransferase
MLRMGLCQLLFLDRVGNHAAVNETTTLAKSFAPGREGLINAVLRAFANDKGSDPFWPRELDRDDTPVTERLATFYSHPEWLVEKLVKERGMRETRAFLAAGNSPPPLVMRVTAASGGREAFAERLPFPTVPTQYSPQGLAPAGNHGRPDLWPGYPEGHFSIQDESSQLTGMLAAPPGGPGPVRVLDCCAGLGGKTFAVLGAWPEARVTAMDTSRRRLEELLVEAQRLRVSDQIKAVEADLTQVRLDPVWDLVLVDCPCTGLGIIRRRPDIKWKRGPEDVGRFAELQSEFLEKAAQAVKPGGRLIYSVCTVTDEEGPEVAHEFLLRNMDFRPATALPEELEPLSGGPGQYRIITHRHRMDGFFYAVMDRDDE